jgi:hypothetical protein
MPYNPLIVNEGKCRPNRLDQEQANQKTSMKQVTNRAWDMFPRNVDWLSTDYTALYFRRYKSSDRVVGASLEIQIVHLQIQVRNVMACVHFICVFEGTCCLHLQGRIVTLISYSNFVWACCNFVHSAWSEEHNLPGCTPCCLVETASYTVVITSYLNICSQSSTWSWDWPYWLDCEAWSTELLQ